MRIRYQSQHGIARSSVAAIRDPYWSSWDNGEERDVTENLRVPVIVYPGTPARETRVIDALLAAGPEFVDAATDTNPDFVCAVDGKPTSALGFYTVDPASGNSVLVKYEDGEGRRVCQEHFLEANPSWIETHAAREGIDVEMILRVRHKAGTALLGLDHAPATRALLEMPADAKATALTPPTGALTPATAAIASPPPSPPPSESAPVQSAPPRLTFEPPPALLPPHAAPQASPPDAAEGS